MELTGKDICDIIKAYKGSGISEIAVGDLVIRRYGDDVALFEANSVRNRPLVQDRIGTETSEAEQINLKEEELALLQVEDPVEWERRLLSGDLVDSMEGVATDEEHSGAE